MGYSEGPLSTLRADPNGFINGRKGAIGVEKLQSWNHHEILIQPGRHRVNKLLRSYSEE
jgi:hypothetical protein